MNGITAKLDVVADRLEAKGFVKEAQEIDIVSNTIEHRVPRSAAEKKMIMLRGISGTGKSTLAKQMENKYGVKAFSTGDYFMKDGKYQFNKKKKREAHAWNMERARKAMKEGKPVIIDNTNVKAWEMKPYVKDAEHVLWSVPRKQYQLGISICRK